MRISSRSWVCSLFSGIHFRKDLRSVGRKFHSACSPCQHKHKLANVRRILLPRLGACIFFPTRARSFSSSGFDISQQEDTCSRNLLNDAIQKIDANRPAIVELISENEGSGVRRTTTTTYGELRRKSHLVADSLLEVMEEDSVSSSYGPRRILDLQGRRVAYMIPPGSTHVAVKLGIWLAGGVAVPLCLSHPLPEIEYVLSDAKPFALIVDPAYETMLKTTAFQHSVHMIISSNIVQMGESRGTTLPTIHSGRPTTMFYTSGTTGKPKGVVHTHSSLSAQVETLQIKWKWSQDDRILHALPLHHVHGVVNALLCPICSGAAVEMLPKFNALTVWNRLSLSVTPVTLFMGVPTMYALLARAWKEGSETQQKEWTNACRRMRLLVCGSDTLSLTLFQLWRTISEGTQTILERYGMTEFGMALSNPLCGERRPSSVGTPLPGVSVRIVKRDEDGKFLEVIKKLEEPGELEVRAPGMFLEYFGRPELTRNSFSDGWFLTGDAAMALSGGYIRILGRLSSDAIKTGGYKVFAPEVEEVLRGNESIEECAVIGVNDHDWGEIVCAVIVMKSSATDGLELNQLRKWAKTRLAPYKVPSKLHIVHELPRNALGKVQKHILREMLL